MDEFDYAYNYQMDGAFIKARTAHRIAERDGRKVTTECGFEFRAEKGALGHDDDEKPVRDRHKCGRCDW